MKIVWLPFALHDLTSISAYHEANASKDIAHRIIRHIVHGASTLTENPYLGRPSESVNGIHELHVAHVPYLLPYRVTGQQIEILRVFHEAQDRPSTGQQ
jgi:addiction module RelE/StbE family toxin